MRAPRRRVARARELDADAVELLDVGRRGRERRDERGAVVAERPRGVEPAAQLPLLAPSERGDATRLARVTLDERERLQHRVVDARGDVGALVRADPRGALGVALEREPPEPGPADEQQRARHGARGEQPRGRARRPASRMTVPMPASAMPPYESGASGRKLPPWRSASARPAATSTIPATPRSETPRAPQQERAGDQEQEDRPARAIRRRPGPEREVEHDAGAAREREQREDEPDERDVHAEGLRDSRADPGEGTPFSSSP